MPYVFSSASHVTGSSSSVFIVILLFPKTYWFWCIPVTVTHECLSCRWPNSLLNCGPVYAAPYLACSLACLTDMSNLIYPKVTFSFSPTNQSHQRHPPNCSYSKLWSHYWLLTLTPLPSTPTATTLVWGIIISHLDYRCSILLGPLVPEWAI